MTLPYSLFDTAWLAPLALLLDLRLGDPNLPWPHPVIGIGRLLTFLEEQARRFPLSPLLGRLVGLISLMLASLLVGALVALALGLPIIGPLMALYLAWAGLAMGSLCRAGDTVRAAILEAPLARARRSLSWLVSRDTRRMDRPLLRKTLADTLAENFTDALCAPFFWLLLTGPIGLWVYKTVSTMDSMWGYTTPRWRYLGWAGARADDLLALIPARIAILVLGAYDWAVRTFCPKKRLWQGHWPGFLALHRQALGMPSPNSGCSMNALAWLCGARMAGPSVYFGSLVQKPWLGPPEIAPLTWDDNLLRVLLRLMEGAALFGMLALWALLLGVSMGVSILLSLI